MPQSRPVHRRKLLFRSHFFGSDPGSTAEYLKTIEKTAHTLAGALPSGPYTGYSASQLRDGIGEAALPMEGCGLDGALKRLETVVANSIAVWHPRVAAHLHTPVLNSALAAELVISALNQSMDSF